MCICFFVGEMGHNCFKLPPLKAISVLSNCADLNRSYKTYKKYKLAYTVKCHESEW